jgi:ferredoxin
VKIHVEPTLCQGHNRCTAVAPALFDIDDEGYASEIGGGTVPEHLTDAARLAADNCPEQAIALSRDA